MAFDLEACPVRADAEDGSLRDLGDELLAYDRPNHRVHVLNGTAREIHRMCDGSRTLAEIARAMVEMYGIDAETARRDLQATLEQFVRLGLVEIRETLA